MAEAVVEDPITRFFCHQCNMAFNQELIEFKCPSCNGEFIEKLDVEEPSDDGSDSDMDSSEVFSQQLEELRDFIRSGPGGRPSDNTRSRRNTIAAPSVTMQPFDHLIQDVIVNLASVGWSPGGAGGRSNGPVFFVGNPGDYAWGREGLDAIVSHLLNQMDGTGPPPLAKEKIEEIPVVKIVEDQVDKNLQCSVCWEDFHLGEPVRKLRCEHVYHENCIIPWLELHGTCPICRKTLTDEGGEDQHQGQGGTNVQNSLAAALFRAAQDSVSSRSTPSFTFSPTLSNSSPASSSSGTSGGSSQHSDQNHDFHLTDLE